MSRRPYFLILILIGLTLAKNADALSAWSTSTHMAYAVNRQSSTGFEKIGGSMTYIDISHSLSPQFDLGLRTLAQGGKTTSREFYRLGSGPVIGWLPHRDWRLEVGMTSFRESGLSPDGEKIYQSRGNSWSFGWERRRQLYPKVMWTYGGIMMAHKGRLAPIEVTNKQPPFQSGQRNDGLVQALQIALHVQLD